ncbi:MAG TPA: PIN domain-containing protein [candidate division Zixibacteria bacterium]|nr:PIN domain-containing protein [candidate division Zixibacteria bacterium]
MDSSFFFPLIGIEITQSSRKAILEVIAKEEVIRSELVIFELSAKGSKLINTGKLTVKDLTQGITAIQYNQKIETIPIYYSEIQTLACELRKHHTDHIDCLIVATAVHHAEEMITLDKELKRKAQEEWKAVIEKENKKFKLVLWEEYEKQKE